MFNEAKHWTSKMFSTSVVNVYTIVSDDSDTEHQLWCKQTEEGAHCTAGVQKQVQMSANVWALEKAQS